MKYKQVELNNKEISNVEVMNRELEVFDVMAANRDKRVHAVARAGTWRWTIRIRRHSSR